jgi:hypothetical protein
MQCERVNMDNYQFYLSVRVQWFKSSEQDSYHVHSLGASSDPKGGDLDNCACWDGDYEDDVTHVLRLFSNLKWSINSGSWQHLAQCACMFAGSKFSLVEFGKLTNSFTLCSKCVLKMLPSSLECDDTMWWRQTTSDGPFLLWILSYS